MGTRLEKEKKKVNVESSRNQSSFNSSLRALNLPIASFSTTDDDQGKSTTQVNNNSKRIAEQKDNSKKSAKKKIPLPLPTSTEIGRKWKEYVIKTREHDRY